MQIAEGLELLPDADDVLPVRVRWVALAGNTAALAIDGDRVYVVSGELTAFELADGSVAWEVAHPEGWALEDSGGVVIGLDGPRVVRVFAPWEYDLRVERATGRRIGFREVVVGGDVPADLVAFPAPLPTHFRVQPDLRETVAFWPDGQVAWRLVVDYPGISALPPVDANGAIVFATTSGHLVVLDPLDSSHG
jgi:outer membrane protein assembly factor BamB